MLDPFVVGIFGPVGSGKSTLLAELHRRFPHYYYAAEPANILVQHGLLDDLYKGVPGAPARFQEAMAVERHLTHTIVRSNIASKHKTTTEPIVVLDGHTRTDRLIYVKYGHAVTGAMSPDQINTYDRLIRGCMRSPQTLNPHVWIYLKTDALLCCQRANVRGRPEEMVLGPDFFFSNCAQVYAAACDLKQPIIELNTDELTTREVANEVADIIATRGAQYIGKLAVQKKIHEL